MRVTSFIIYFLTIFSIDLIHSARILVVLPTPSYSRNVVYRTIYRELSLRGHDLVVFTTDPLNDPTLPNLKEIDMSFLYKYATDLSHQRLDDYLIRAVAGIKSAQLEISREIFLHPEMRSLLNNSNERFDLLVVEWDSNPSLVALSKRFDCPMVGMKSLGLDLEGHDSLGNPTNPSYIPMGWRDFRQNFWGRLDNFVFGIIWRLHHHLFVLPKAQRLANEMLPEFSGNILDVVKNVSIVLTNTHPILTGVRPLMLAVIEIGGIHLKAEKQPLPNDVRQYLDRAKKGVVYCNLGSNVKGTSFGPMVLKLIISALSEIPYKVIWRWEEDVVDLPLNVKTWKWLPQQAILGHPNIKAFITNGGLLSVMEGVDNQVPMLGIPLFADQYINVRNLQKFKIGKRIDIRNFNNRAFVVAVKKLIKNPTYKNNIANIKSIFHDLPMRPLDKAVWWIEYVLRHQGARHVRSPAVDLDWITYLLLDVLFIFAVSVLLSIAVLYFACRYLLSRIVSGKTGKEKTN